MDYWLTKMLIMTRTRNALLFLLLLGLLDLHRVACLFVTDINVPGIVDFRDNVTLSCSYDMNGHTLNSVKWYKNDKEFFRYSPRMHPEYMKFPVDGVQVLNGEYFCNESLCRVELSSLGIKSTGVYRCEVSEDAPYFLLKTRAANMTVAALPQYDPRISNFQHAYREDDFITANCSSDYSSLPVKLSWTINNEQASTYMDLQPSIETIIPAHDYNLRLQSLQLSFYANDPRFQHATASRNLMLKCVAEIENFPELKRETTLTAVLLRDDELRNQKLINSGATKIKLVYGLLFLQILIYQLQHYGLYHWINIPAARI